MKPSRRPRRTAREIAAAPAGAAKPIITDRKLHLVYDLVESLSGAEKDAVLAAAMLGQPTDARGSGAYIQAGDISDRPLFVTAGHVCRDGGNFPDNAKVIGGKIFTPPAPALYVMGKVSDGGNEHAALEGTENLKASTDLDMLFIPQMKISDLDSGNVSPRNDFGLAIPPAGSRPPAPSMIGAVGVAREHETVTLIGFLGRGGRIIRDMYLTQGRTLSNPEARAAVKAHFGPGAQMAYDEKSEFVVNTNAAPGMSGGPVLNSKGEVIGIIESAPGDHAPFVRVVRIEYIIQRLKNAIAEMPEKERTAIFGKKQGESTHL